MVLIDLHLLLGVIVALKCCVRMFTYKLLMQHLQHVVGNNMLCHNKLAACLVFQYFVPLLQALRDLADPAEGVYNATALLDERLKYIIGMLDKYQKVPGGPARVSNYLTAGVPINKSESKESESEQSESSSQSSPDTEQSEQSIREQLNALATNAAQFVRSASFTDAAPAQSNGVSESAGVRSSNSSVADADVGKDGKLVLGGQRSSIATELTDFRRQNQNSNNAVSFEGVRRRIAMFITSDDI